jgi:hypothetical protein
MHSYEDRIWAVELYYRYGAKDLCGCQRAPISFHKTVEPLGADL